MQTRCLIGINLMRIMGLIQMNRLNSRQEVYPVDLISPIQSSSLRKMILSKFQLLIRSRLLVILLLFIKLWPEKCNLRYTHCVTQLQSCVSQTKITSHRLPLSEKHKITRVWTTWHFLHENQTISLVLPSWWRTLDTRRSRRVRRR